LKKGGHVSHVMFQSRGGSLKRGRGWRVGKREGRSKPNYLPVGERINPVEGGAMYKFLFKNDCPVEKLPYSDKISRPWGHGQKLI